MRNYFAALLACWLASTARGQAADSTSPLPSGPIRKLEGTYLTLWTDAPADPEVDELTLVFDRAVPLWAKRFGVPERRYRDWHVTGYLMRSAGRFHEQSLVPADLPPFLHGYQRQDRLWLNDQPSTYYRRHLLLHEGTHAFMSAHLGGLGPPWYAEGMAEYLATHRWQQRQLTLAYQPQDRSEVPLWGRWKIIHQRSWPGRERRSIARSLTPQDVQSPSATAPALDQPPAAKVPMLEHVFTLPPSAFLHTESYAWSWGAVTLLDQHPASQDRFRSLAQRLRSVESDWTEKFTESLHDSWPQLVEAWQLLVTQGDYGYRVPEDVLVEAPTSSPVASPTTVRVRSDHGWQSTGLVLQAHRSYRVTAEGRFAVAQDPRPWWCEPGGITLEYYRGRPLGRLLAAVRPSVRDPSQLTPLAMPLDVGEAGTITPNVSGVLCLRINEMAGKLSDNQGTVTVEVRPDGQ